MRAFPHKILAGVAALTLAVLACNLPGSLAAMPTLAVLNTPAAPQATPAAAALPVVAAPQIVSFKMLDTRNGWALTAAGVVRTADGGSTWQNATPSGVTAVGEQASAFFLDAHRAWVLIPGTDPSSGTLYRTADGGATWTGASVPFGGALLQFRDASNGAALLSLGAGAGSEAVAIDTTVDGGASWTQVFVNDPTVSGSNASLPLGGMKNGLSFLDAGHAWVGGSEPINDFIYFFASADGGHTWNQLSMPLPEAYTGAMTSADAPRFFGTSDGALPVFLYGDSQAMVFFLSHDGGATWKGTRPVAMAGHYSLASLTDWFVWDGGAALQVSHDSGGTWTAVATNVSLTDTLTDFQFVDASHGWALSVDANGHTSFYATTDGGATWTALIP